MVFYRLILCKFYGIVGIVEQTEAIWTTANLGRAVMKLRVLPILLILSILFFGGCEVGITDTDSMPIPNDGITSMAETTKPASTKEPEHNSTEISDKLIVTFLDVGQGDSIFIELPDNKIMLIDAGNPQDGDSIVNIIKNKGFNRVDFLFATHPHADHIGGMQSVVESLNIGTIYMPRVEHTTQTFLGLLTAIEQKGYKVKTAKVGVNIINTQDLKLDIVAPNSDFYNDLNNYSAVIKLTYKDVTFLFCGDAERVSENEMIASGYDLSADVLKVGHHGSTSASSLSFLKQVNPKYAIISCGKDNSYGHPTDDTLNHLSSLGIKIYRTDEVGTIAIRSDGTTYTIDKNAAVIQANAPPPVPKAETPAPTPTLKEDAPKTAPNDVIVYKTQTGGRYHTNGCRYLNKSKIETTIQHAKNEGLTPCSVCKPLN